MSILTNYMNHPTITITLHAFIRITQTPKLPIPIPIPWATTIMATTSILVV